MRVSSRPSDPGYKNLVRGTRVYLGDREIKDAVTADDASGMVEHLVRDAAGHLVTHFNPVTQRADIKTAYLFGQVFIERPSPPPKPKR